ncbi:MAG: two-component regulator propeller domain-containing protein [Ferruginibacter sp.]
MFQKALILLLSCFAYFFQAHGQVLYFQSYSSEQGLSQNSVYSIAQTKEGFMWFGTQDGLNRFDGKNFFIIQPVSDSLQSEGFGRYSKMITALYADRNDWLWVGTTQEVALYNRYLNKYIFPAVVYKGFSLPKGVFVQKITEDTKHNIWLLTQNDGLFCYSNQLKKMIPYNIPDNAVSFTCGNKGDIYASSKTEIYKLTAGVFIPIGIQKLLPRKKLSIFETAIINNQLWFITGSAEIIILSNNAANNYTVNYFSKQFKGNTFLSDPRLIYQSDSNTVWIGSRSDGLVKVDTRTKTFENAAALGTSYSLKSQFVLSFFTNPQKITWIGLSGGIAKYDEQKTQFGLWRNEPVTGKPVPDNKLLSVFSDNDEDFYMGTLNGGLLHLNIKNGLYQYYQPDKYLNKNPESKNIYQVISGSKNMLWMATWGGLYSFNRVTQHFKLYSDTGNIQTTQLCAVVKLKRQNKILAGGYKGGLCLFNPDKQNWEPINDVQKVLNKNKPLRVRYMEEKDGKVYMATEAQNLVIYDYLTGTFTFFPALQQISCDCRHFCFKDNNIWVATTDGLIQVDENTMQIIKTWNSSNGLPNNYIYAALPADNGHIWLSSNAGLASLDYTTGLCKKFTENDGLQGMEFNTASCFKDSNGYLWFGGINGLNKVNPQLNKENNFSPAPLITNVNVMNSPYSTDSATPYIHTITLPHTKNFISFEFKSPNFSQSENIIYEYMMKGIDTGWIKNGTRNYVNYTQLKPGNYTFMVKAANTNYYWSRDVTEMQIKIIPPWYKTWWFYLLTFFSSFIFFAWLFNQRVKIIHYRAAMKQKITETEMAALKAQMNPHFMFNCINSIDAFIQSNDKYNATLYLNKFAKLIRNILDSSKENTVYLSKDIETLKLYIELEELRSDNKFSTQINIDQELINSDYKVPPLIIQPFVENAIIHGLRNKETNDGKLELNISKNNRHIIYSIKDNGVGRETAKTINTGKEKSYGMQMSFDRIKLFNKEEKASVTITDLYENEKANGTHILVNLNLV